MNDLMEVLKVLVHTGLMAFMMVFLVYCIYVLKDNNND